MRVALAWTVVVVGCGSSGERPVDATGAEAMVDAVDLDAPPTSSSMRCGAPVPSGAQQAPPLPSYTGTCPALAVAPGLTQLASSGSSREFMVVAPQTIAPGERLPLVFVWHWLGGSAGDAYDKLSLAESVELRRFIAIVPEAKGDILFRWPFGVNQSDARLDEELRFFDDMLACVGAELPVDKDCVSSMGISAGALWTAQLAPRRADRLASFASISGGIGQQARDWFPASRALPAFVLWGGPTDMYPDTIPLERFDEASLALEDALVPAGHLIEECIHNCGHGLPPFDPPPPGKPPFDVIWSFLLDHPFWLPAGTSIYQQQLPAETPSWCGLGQGGAVPREAAATCPE